MKGASISAADTFGALYKLEAMRRISEEAFRSFDMMALPTAPSAYTVDEVLKNPIELNSRNGTYTNFVNLLDMCGLAIPSSMRDDGIPFGITLLAPAGEDALLASVGHAFHADTGLTLGSLGAPQPSQAVLPNTAKSDEIIVAVVGAHLSGMPLNGELRALDARLLEATTTEAAYKLYALKGTAVPKPGLIRVADGAGAMIALELWALSAEAFGKFVAAVPSPLSIGTIRLADGRSVKGFLVEPAALGDATDISDFGGWRSYIAANS
jgi:allophanate hydrolase